MMDYGQCQVSVAPLRAEPAHRSEQVSQLIFGEKVRITGSALGSWVPILTAQDAYAGWCLLGQLQEISKQFFKKPDTKLSGTFTGKIILQHGDIALPFGANLTHVRKGGTLQHDEIIGLKAKSIKISSPETSLELVTGFAKYFLNTPYAWGGRTLMGIDCSGLTQIAYRAAGHKIPRDASQQAKIGEQVYFLNDAQAGDLAFFENEEGRINHVGMLLDTGRILHATETSGKVVIDRLDQEGIISTHLKTRTHRLRMLKRIIPKTLEP